MQVEVMPLSNFVHGHLNTKEGRPIWIEETVARDLERAGLVRIMAARAVPAERVDLGKPEDDGQGQPSSVSQAAPASRTTISPRSRSGARRAAKSDASSS